LNKQLPSTLYRGFYRWLIFSACPVRDDFERSFLIRVCNSLSCVSSVPWTNGFCEHSVVFDRDKKLRSQFTADQKLGAKLSQTSHFYPKWFLGSAVNFTIFVFWERKSRCIHWHKLIIPYKLLKNLICLSIVYALLYQRTSGVSGYNHWHSWSQTSDTYVYVHICSLDRPYKSPTVLDPCHGFRSTETSYQ
jgi:hypothetical protein